MMEALKNVWEGAIPLQIHLHESEVTTLPPPSPALILAPRIGYLPLLVPQIKPHFSGALPPGADTVWFDYRGLPLKWNIPTGVLFDLLCVEPERPWNLTVHFRGYPGNILVPWEGEDSVKWSFINSLKEASYITLGNCKNIMNMSQPDQVELWCAVLNSMSGNLEAYLRVSSKLKLGTVGDEYAANLNPCSSKSRQSIGDMDGAGQVKTGRVPVRLYVRRFTENFDDLEDAPQIDNWDKTSYINRPVEIHGEEGKCFTLLDAVKDLLPEYFTYNSFPGGGSSREEGEDELKVPSEEGEEKMSEHVETCCPSNDDEVKLVRIQGIEPKLEIPFSWVVNNLRNPEYFLHVCVFLKVPKVEVP